MRSDAVDAMNDSVAARVAEARKLAGLTQAQLAMRAHLSLSLVRKVERGVVPASPTFIASTAQALGLLVTDLTEQRNFRSIRSRYGVEQRFIPDLERAIIEGENAVLDGPLLDLPELANIMAQVVNAGRASKYTDVLEALPNLLRHLYAQSLAVAPGKFEYVNRLLAQAYYSAMFATYKFGHLSLSAWAAERMSLAAESSGDPLWAVMGQYSRAQALMFGGSYRASGVVLDKAASELRQSKDPRSMEVLGAVHLSGAIIAARLGDSTDSDTRLQEARDLARHIQTTDDQFDTAFSAANVEIHAIAAAVELSNPAKALKRGAALDLRGKLYRSRMGHYHIDLARAYLMQGNHDQVVHELSLARQLSPQQTRYHPQVHETIRAVARARRRSDPVTRLAAWAGVE
ncbi:MAG TPA: helix-turn-helix transcriptional regulator [Pseudonocardiaceae bacterium]|nr:helix-turn-helix transcriptional regulator [Pseudonocardiaceae bacterium]